MLGLSATPDENANKFDRIAWWGIGPVLVAKELLGYQSIDCNFTATVYRIQYLGPESHTRRLVNEATAMTSTAETIGMICSDQYRTALVLDCIAKCLEQNRYTYVFAWTRDYLEQLRIALNNAYHIDGTIVTDEKEFIRLVGGSKAADLEHAELKSRVIFTTYAYGATGRSIIKMDAAVLATPRKSKMKQTIGRILRLGSDASINRLIYDICDMKLSLKNQWSVRNKYYKSKLFTIETIVKQYTDINMGVSDLDNVDNVDSVDDVNGEENNEMSTSVKKVDYALISRKIRESLTN
jgi:superfamily II DNA or RNA helicase